MSESQIIVLANQKGGCGKTTTSVSLAAALIERGYDACVVDLDSQCNVSSIFEVNSEELKREGRYTVLDAYLGRRPAQEIVLATESEDGVRFGVVPGHRALDQVHPKLEADLKSSIARDDQSPLDEDDIRQEQRERLKISLESLKPFFQFIIVDTPPQLGFLLTSALIAADKYLIPVFASGFDLDGLSKLTTTVRKVRERANPNLELLGVVLGNFDATTKLDSDVYKMLVGRFGDKMFETTIARSVKHREATVYRATIFDHAPGSPAAKQFLSLADEVLGRLAMPSPRKRQVTGGPSAPPAKLTAAEAANE